MSHIHDVNDSDNKFIVDGISRVIKNTSASKTTVMQFDHNSEVFTFEIPRYIEGHDMMECNRVEVHYLNIDTSTRKEKEGIYLVNDLKVNPDDETKLNCSWVISQNATMLVGSLNFLLRFICLTDDVINYVWNTSICSGIYVSKGIYNSEIVAEQYLDTITLDDGTELPKPTLKDGCNYAIIFKNSNYYSMLETSNRFANVNSWISIANSSYTIGTSSAVCYISRLPVNFNEFNSWSEPTEYDLSNASFTTLGTLILSNEIIEKWSSTSTNTKVIYFNKNCDL